MNKEEEVSPKVPTDSGMIPQVPNPQTFAGTLGQDGQQLNPRPIGVPMMDMDMCSVTWRYITSFTISATDNPGDTLFEWNPWCPRALQGNTIPTRIYSLPHWQDMALLSSEYFNATPVYRFWLVSPDIIQGRYYFQYNPIRATLTPNNFRRQPIIEWDLSLSDFIDIKAPSFSQMGIRPTRRNTANIDGQVAASPLGDQLLPWSYYDAGRMSFHSQNSVQIIDIFPQTYDIVVLQTFENMEQYCMTTPYRMGNLAPNLSGTLSDYVLELNID